MCDMSKIENYKLHYIIDAGKIISTEKKFCRPLRVTTEKAEFYLRGKKSIRKYFIKGETVKINNYGKKNMFCVKKIMCQWGKLIKLK
jgi:hypothetical protein